MLAQISSKNTSKKKLRSYVKVKQLDKLQVYLLGMSKYSKNFNQEMTNLWNRIAHAQTFRRAHLRANCSNTVTNIVVSLILLVQQTVLSILYSHFLEWHLFLLPIANKLS